jgi:hypothetical protein
MTMTRIAIVSLFLLACLELGACLSQDARVGQSLLRKTSWPLKQSKESPSGSSVRIDSIASISNTDQLTILGDVEITSKGKLMIIGDEASLFSLNLNVVGLIAFEFDEEGPKTSINIEGEVFISDRAKLSIEASAYTGGEGTIRLLEYTSLDGAFAPDRVAIIGLDSSLHAELIHGHDSLDLVIKSDGTSSGEPDDMKPSNESDANIFLFKAGSHLDTHFRYHYVS